MLEKPASAHDVPAPPPDGDTYNRADAVAADALDTPMQRAATVAPIAVPPVIRR
jgi:hypothetical protein